MVNLFDTVALRGITLRNRLALSPMCQYEAAHGYVSDYHAVHYGKFALGGFGLVVVEATAVSPEARITHGDLGIWDDRHIEGLERIARFVKDHGAIPGIQIAHAGPQASMQRPHFGDGPLTDDDVARGDHPWPVVSASANPVADGWLVPSALDDAGIAKVRQDFASATRRALQAGFEIIEMHAAHGYLLNAFLSPLTNKRTDAYGGSRENRMRLTLEIAEEMRSIIPQDKPLFVRISAVDGSNGGVTIEDSIALARELKRIGVDVIDCSSGGIGLTYDYPTGYGYQVPYAHRIKAEVGVATMAVGLIVDPEQAQAIVQSAQADIVALGREALVNPNFPHQAEQVLGIAKAEAPFDNWVPQIAWYLNARQRKLDRLGAWKAQA